ncbi:MAG TPA: hypothetical protein VFX59_02595 [Polyangiales bacterium]|nr:hypothetical protein [Polyangiales bacterium]
MWAAGCLSAPPPNLYYDEAETTSQEVYRVFCRRVAKGAYPQEQVGLQFYEQCDTGDPEAEEQISLKMMLRYRDEIMGSFKRAFAEGEGVTDGVQKFQEGELSGFLKALVPLYDKPQETIPTTTRGIAALLERLIDPNDARANKVIETVARLVQRNGYRPAEFNIGAIRAILTYPKLEELSTKLLPVLSTVMKENGDKEPGAAREQFIALLNALALELADEPVPVPNRADSTLRRVLELALVEDAKQASGKVGTTLILDRDDQGNALGNASAGTPFAVAGREDEASERDDDGVAMSGGKRAYATIDASQTVLAALTRETSALIKRETPDGDPKDRAPIESFAHGVRPLLGPWGARTLTIGKNNYAFQGPDLAKSALMQFAHAATTLAKYPETITLLKALDALLTSNESEATAVAYAALAINERGKQHDEAKLNGPHELWDDLTAAAVRMSKRPGLIEGLIRSFAEPASAAQGKMFATWMRYSDELSYPNSPSTKPEDINAPVADKPMTRVDRDAPNVGFNRSIWQRTMSLINALNGQKVCNKKGGIIKATTGIGELFFPAFRPEGYNECELAEIQDAVEVYSLALIDKGEIEINDAFAAVLSDLGKGLGISGNVGEIQESESGIKGFTDKPTPAALARFIFAPRNEWVNNLFGPQLTNYKVDIAQYEPNALFPMEALDDKTPLNGAPSNFIAVGKPLIKAFDDFELRMAPDPLSKPKLVDGYMFGHLLSVLHQHWPLKSTTMCSEMLSHDSSGCTQSLDRNAPFYAPQTGLASYEELLAEAFDDEDFVGVLSRASAALIKVSVAGPSGNVDGAKALGDFLQRMVTVDPTLAKWTGEKTTRSNLCQDDGAGGCVGGVGKAINELAPIHLLADALHAMDEVWAAEPERHEAWLQGRSDLVDQLLTTERSGSASNYKYQLRDRTAYEIVHPTLSWLAQQLERHQQANDLETWAIGGNGTEGLSERLAKVLRHPITAGVIDLLDAFWPEEDASGAFTEVVSYMTDESNESTYRAMLTAIADSIMLLDRDNELSPAIQFAALALAPNVFEAIDGAELPNADKSTAYAALELTAGVVTILNDPKKNEFKKDGEPTALTKLLGNVVLATPTERSALEVLIDAAADVNRTNVDATALDPLTAEEDRDVFGDVKLFLKDDKSDQRSMERLYQVIQHRKAD